MKKIILIGAIYYDNLGDAALCDTTKKFLSDIYRVEVLDIYGRKSFPVKKMYNPDECYTAYKRVSNRLKLRKLFLKLGFLPYDRSKKDMFEAVNKQLKESIDNERPAAIVFAGGALLKGVFLNSIIRIIEFAEKNGIPVIFSACGIDSRMLPIEWKKVKRILFSDSVRYISVRDGKEILDSRFPQLKIYDTFDSAICANKLYRKKNERHEVGLGVMLFHNFDFSFQVKFWRKLIVYLDEQNIGWKMFTNGSVNDQVFAEYILKSCGKNEKLMVRSTKPSELYSLISGFEMIVSMRLHSIILAYSSDTPAIALAWDQKINEFCNKIGKDEYCLDLHASENEILDKIRTISNNKSSFYSNKSTAEQKVYNNFSKIKSIIGN